MEVISVTNLATQVVVEHGTVVSHGAGRSAVLDPLANMQLGFLGPVCHAAAPVQ